MATRAVRWKIARRHLNRRRTHRLRWSLAAALAILLLLSGGGAAAGMYFASQLPPVSRFHIRYTFQDARIYDAAGDLLYTMADLSKQHGRRIVEPLQDRNDTDVACRGGVNRIPRVLQDATIATEDATFYKNPGFDVGSIVRAALDDITYGHIVSGASTITQQVVRDTMLNRNERTFSRKAQEVALAYEIARHYSKRKILWYYLNSVPYGNTAIGAQAAAEVYFGIPVCRLDLAQAALLAGLPRAPTLYDPVRYPAVALARMREVLGLLRKHGYLHSMAPIDAAIRESRGWRFRAPGAPIRYPQFVRYAVDQLKGIPRLRAQLYAGIDVYTTLDPRLQDMAQRTVTRQIDGLVAQNVTDGALVSLDLRAPHYGWILAMVGSAHYRGRAGQINMAITPRQPGSSMKPFNYIWAFEHGAGPGTTVVDSPIRLPDPNDPEDGGWYQPTNYDHTFHGQVTLRQALANSLNVPAVKVEYYITHPDRVAQTAARFGMSSLYRDNPGLGCSVCYAVTLGGLSQGTRLLEETAAYGVFATGGVTVPPVAIWKVTQRVPGRATGRVIYCSEDCPRGVRPDPALAGARRQVLDWPHAYEMTNVLSDNNARCTPQVCEFGLTSPLLLDRPSAAKTGTTNAWTDNWTVGYTPQIISGVWVGNADRSPMRHVIGVTGAAPIWHDFMERAFKLLKLPKIWYVAPGSVVTTNRCTLPGSRAVSYGAADITLATSPPPLCALPERGFMPLKCPPARLLPNLQCAATPYTYTYGYGSQNQPYTYYSQSGSAQPNAFGSPSPQGNVPASP